MLTEEDKIEIREMLREFKEELKNEFAQVPEHGDTLPDIKSIGDKVLFIKDNTLYITHNGEWKTIGSLT